jgi:hypothetical protein
VGNGCSVSHPNLLIVLGFLQPDSMGAGGRALSGRGGRHRRSRRFYSKSGNEVQSTAGQIPYPPPVTRAPANPGGYITA